ncbi:MAG: 1-acyl-sn-glycerol-3-phosphate acyltransferase [Porticoccaceae bacterium]|nr:1-acyl-sn-glycerol-3-phosphate acyltransferase [Porticoccaceae bacterium]
MADTESENLARWVPGHHRAYRSAWVRRLANAVFCAAGWRLRGEVPDDNKMVLVVGPHTSNWDFVVAMVAMLALDINIHWLGKHTLFRKPLGRLMVWLGGIPVNRTKAEGFAADIAGELRRANQLLLGITPEGTRSPVAKLKTGFSRIARETPCPIVPVTLDFCRRELCIHPPMQASDDSENDASLVRQIFATAQPRNPANF